MPQRIVIFVAWLSFSANSWAIVFGGSNLSLSNYPSHTCIKPSKPYKPYSFGSQWEVDSYNDEVERYNRDLKYFFDCINEYVENASNDIKRIKEKAQEAIQETQY